MLATGMIDAILPEMSEGPIATAIDQAMRLSPSRRIDRRLRHMTRRGAESVDAAEAGTLELMDLKELQANFLRSVEEFRQRFESRDFVFPAPFHGKSPLANLNLPKWQFAKPDLVEMRDRLVAKSKAAVSGPNRDHSS
jgi:hypothetical protein